MLSPDNSKQENEILYNSKYLKQINYDYAAKKESSYTTYTAYEGSDIDKIDYFLIKWIDFEKNWDFFFDSYFKLIKLPNIFFPILTFIENNYPKKLSINKKNKGKNNSQSHKKSSSDEENDKIIFEIYVDSIFKSFIETDFARINPGDVDIQPDFTFRPFLIEPNICVYQDEKNGNKWICKENKSKEFKIYGKSIILGEIKNSIPEKILNIKKDEIIDVKKVQRALYFVLYKLIKKIDYYSQLVKFEILKDSEDIKNYKFQLFLIYNNKPISQMNTFIISCLKNLINNGYIKNKFIFQIIYSSPSISSLNINNLSKEIKEVKDNNAKIKKEISKLKVSEAKKSEEIQRLDFEIQNLKNQMKLLKGIENVDENKKSSIEKKTKIEEIRENFHIGGNKESLEKGKKIIIFYELNLII